MYLLFSIHFGCGFSVHKPVNFTYRMILLRSQLLAAFLACIELLCTVLFCSGFCRVERRRFRENFISLLLHFRKAIGHAGLWKYVYRWNQVVTWSSGVKAKLFAISIEPLVTLDNWLHLWNQDRIGVCVQSLVSANRRDLISTLCRVVWHRQGGVSLQKLHTTHIRKDQTDTQSLVSAIQHNVVRML